MAKMPVALVEQPQRTLADLARGEHSLFPLHGVRVDLAGDVFVTLNSDLPPPRDKLLEYGEIWLDEHGKYHLHLKSTKRKWTPEDLSFYFLTKKPSLVAVESVTWTEAT